jgi:glycosyltransferase involved in cell wall biosynthesis
VTGLAGEPALDLLVVADSLDGGLGASALAHARWFRQQGWQVLLAAVPASAAAPPEELVPLPVPATAFDLRGMLGAARGLRAVLRAQRPSVVHTHGTRAQLLVLLAGRRPFVTMHGAGRVEGQGALGTAVRRLARRVAARLSVRAFSAAPAGGGWQTLLHASPRLADLDRLPVDASDPAAPPTFVWLGRLDAPKRPEVFIRACAAASHRQPLRGVVVGDGPMRAGLERLAAAEAAPVEFVGQRDDVLPYLAQARGVCLFSDFEGVPFTVQEAMWAGRPVVLSPLPSLRWFAAGSALYAASVAEATEALLTLCHPGEAERRGFEAAARVRELVTADAPFPELLAAYRLSASTSR